ncbi:MAG: hypothetical protein M1134_07095 [Actinobacteria bacterium]|nr:hypothetical protein [Actinomycetota bacterium]MCL5444898.1 hypothetical protein [Actinomycetota bacterium]
MERPLAPLVPINEDRWQDLVASGHVLAATEEGDVADDAPNDYGIDASGVLVAVRAE